MNTSTLEKQLTSLPREERARLRDLLDASLGGEQTAEIAAAWSQEASRRLEELRSGKVAGVPVSESLSRAREQFS
jgi:putative addiction module component (TIGR02574 family)